MGDIPLSKSGIFWCMEVGSTIQLFVTISVTMWLSLSGIFLSKYALVCCPRVIAVMLQRSVSGNSASGESTAPKCDSHKICWDHQRNPSAHQHGCTTPTFAQCDDMLPD